MDPYNQQPGSPSSETQTPQNLTTQPSPTGKYDFILDTQHKPKKSLVPRDGSFKSRLLLLVGGAIAVIIAIIAVSSLLGGGENNTQLLTKLAAEQTEIIRITDLGLRGSTNQDTQIYVQTVKSSVTTDLTRVVGYLAANKIKLKPIELNSQLNKDVDDELTSATASNQFDEVIIATLKARLNTYSGHLSELYKLTSSVKSKMILNEGYKSTALLLK